MNLKFLRFQTRPPKGASEEPEPPGRALRRLSRASPEQKATTRKQTYAPGGHSGLLKLAGREEKQTTSLITTRKTAILFSVFTEKRKNAGLSLKSCAEYTKINGKFNRGFTAPGRTPEGGRRLGRNDSGVRAPTAKSVGRKGRPLRPLLVLPKGSTLHFPTGGGAPFFQAAEVYSSKVRKHRRPLAYRSIAAAVLSNREGRTAVRDKLFKEEE